MFSVDELLEKAEDFAERFEFELAAKFYQRALDGAPDNTEIMDDLAEVLLELGQADSAKQLLNKSIQLSPNDNFSKYLNLAQHLEGKEALDCTDKGIQLMIRQNQRGDLNEQISSAYMSMAEVYLTDSCYDDDAETKTQHYLDEALRFLPNNPEALQVLSSLRISQSRPKEALEILLNSFNIWKEADNQPSFPFRITTARQFIELESYSSAIEVLEVLLEELDTNPEVWYLLGLAHDFSNDYINSFDCLTRALEILNQEASSRPNSQPSDDPLRKSVEELLKKVQEKKPADDDADAMEVEDEKEDQEINFEEFSSDEDAE